MESIKDLIVHNDHHLVVVNKPAAHPLTDQKESDQAGLMNRLQAYVKRDLFLVNRIDTPVSGLVVFGKTRDAAADLSQQFKERTIRKIYLAVSRDRSKEDEGSWTDHVKQLSKMNKSVSDEHGKEAMTTFKWLESLDHVHLYLLKPQTGRHHQLRLQMAANLSPIRGDQKYGDKRGNRDRSIDLHAWALRLKHPSTGETLDLVAELPDGPPWKHFEIFKNQKDVGQYLED